MTRPIPLLVIIMTQFLWANSGPNRTEPSFSDSAGITKNDSILTAETLSIPEFLPPWFSPEDGSGVISPDTLAFVLTPANPARKVWARRQRLVGLGMIAVCASLSHYVHNKADQAYQDYLQSGDLSELDQLFHRVEQLDRLSGWLYLGAEAGVLMVAVSFIIGP